MLHLCVKSVFLLSPNKSEIVQSKDSKSNLENINFSSHYLSSIEHKLDSVTNVLSTVDTSIKALEEKAHTWAIFRHHIDSWNEQMKSLERKIDLIKRTQDETFTVGNRILALELTLNHILSKVLYLTENCSNNPILKNAQTATGNSFCAPTVDRYFEIHRLLVADRKMRSEIGTRLSNILRHVQNIENENCRPTKSVGGNSYKVARLMHPIGTGSACNATQRCDVNIEQSLKSIKEKISALMQSFSPKDIKQITAITKKNIKSLDDILHFVTMINERSILLHDLSKEHETHLSNNHQTISGELAAFTESSEMVLKRIEKAVIEVKSKLEHIPDISINGNDSSATVNENIAGNSSVIGKDIEDDATVTVQNPTSVHENKDSIEIADEVGK